MSKKFFATNLEFVRFIGENDFHSVETKKVNEIKEIDIHGISKIKVDLDFADLIIRTTNRTNIQVNCRGNIRTAGEFIFDIIKEDDTIKISIKIASSFTRKSIFSVHILIPQILFNLISIKSQNGSVELHENVNAQKIKVKCQNGIIDSEADFCKMNVKSMNGNINILVNAKQDIDIKVLSMNGKVKIELENIELCDILASSINGFVRNKHIPNGKYKAVGNALSMNGSVTIC